MRVSIVIPLYNHASFIEKAMVSVLEQTHPDIELIVIDDGSSDNSADIAEAILKKYPNRMGSVTRQANQGAHNAINNGLKKATGDFLTILNSDDYFHLRRLEICLRELQKRGAECAFTLVAHINQQGAELAATDPAKGWYSRSLADETTAVSVSHQLLSSNIAVSSGNIIFSRRLWSLTKGFRNYKLAHDWDFLMQIIPHSEPIFIKEKLYYYRIHTGNASHEVNQFLAEESKAIYKDYFLSIALAKPQNPYAPSFENWSYNFIGFQHRGLMLEAIKGLIHFHSKAEEAPATYSKIVPLVADKKTAITLVSHDFSLSGAPRLVADIAIYLQEHGHQVHVVGLHGGALSKEFDQRGISHSLLFGRLSSRLHNLLPKKFKYLLTPICMLLHIRKLKGTLLFNTTVTQIALLSAMLLFPWKKFVWYVHESNPPSALHVFSMRSKLFERLTHFYRKKNKFELWFGAKNTQTLWQNEGVEGRVMYWSGIAKTDVTREKRPIRNIITAGTVDPRKGSHYLFDAFVQCHQAQAIPANTRLTIVGFLDFYTEFTYDFLLKIIRSGYADKVDLVGICSKAELDNYFDRADVYVQASVMECMPIALLTAMSRSIPVITTDVDGCIEAIPDESHGWICPARHIHSLATALAGAVNNPEKASEKAAKAKAFFDTTFAREATAPKLFNDR